MKHGLVSILLLPPSFFPATFIGILPLHNFVTKKSFKKGKDEAINCLYSLIYLCFKNVNLFVLDNYTSRYGMC